MGKYTFCLRVCAFYVTIFENKKQEVYSNGHQNSYFCWEIDLTLFDNNFWEIDIWYNMEKKNQSGFKCGNSNKAVVWPTENK